MIGFMETKLLQVFVLGAVSRQAAWTIAAGHGVAGIPVKLEGFSPGLADRGVVSREPRLSLNLG